MTIGTAKIFAPEHWGALKNLVNFIMEPFRLKIQENELSLEQ